MRQQIPVVWFSGNGSGISTFAASSTLYVTIPASSHFSNTATEANRQVTMEENGMMYGLMVCVKTASTTASTLTTRKNAAAGAQTITLTANTTGYFSDLVNKDQILAGEKWNLRIVTGTGVSAHTAMSVLFIPAVPTSMRMSMAGAGAINPAAAQNDFFCIGGTDNFTTTEAPSKTRIEFAGVWKNFFARCGTNGRASSATVYFSRINGVSGTMTVSFAASTTGFLEDLVNTDTVAAGNDLDILLAAGTGTGSFTVDSVATTLTNTTNTGMVNASDQNGTAQAITVTNFFPIGGRTSVSTTETNAKMQARLPLTFRNTTVTIQSNTNATAANVRFRKNGANGNINVVITGSTSGIFTDLVNTDTVVATDDINWTFVTAGASGSITWNVVHSEYYCPVFNIPDPVFVGNQAMKRAALY